MGKLIDAAVVEFMKLSSATAEAGWCFEEMRDYAARIKPLLERFAANVEAALDEKFDSEIRRFQDGVRDKLISLGVPDSCIDGAGCDSGDPLDFTLAEITQGVGYFIDRTDELEAAAKSDRDKLVDAIVQAATKAGIIEGSQPLTGPHLVMLLDDLQDAMASARDKYNALNICEFCDVPIEVEGAEPTFNVCGRCYNKKVTAYWRHIPRLRTI